MTTTPPAPVVPLDAASAAPPFVWPVRVYWEDTDAGGIVFYANYLKFFERARTEWLRHLGVEQQALREQTGGMFVVGGTEVRYHRPARLDDVLHVSAAVAELGRASITLTQQAWLQPAAAHAAAAAVLLAEGQIRIGWVDTQTWRPARIPAAIVDVLQPYAHCQRT